MAPAFAKFIKTKLRRRRHSKVKPLLPFNYAPLTARQIRLVQITRTVAPELPGQGSLRCELRVESLDDLSVPYQAISYVCGDPARSGKILCGDESHYIPLSAAASTLVEVMAATKTTQYIWIDALCIAQDDEIEKAQQVRLMRDVFQKAEKVIAWLGYSTPDTSDAIKFISSTFDSIVELKRRNESPDLDNLEPTSPGWKHFSKLLENPFFVRAWIVQEMVLASHVDVMYGSDVVSWEIIGQTVFNIFKYGLNSLIGVDETRAPAGLMGLERTFSLRLLRKDGGATSLLTCLFVFWVFASSDPRDKVFALLGIANDGGDTAFEPEYGDTTAETIYTRVARHFLAMRSAVHNQPQTVPAPDILHSAGIGHSRKLLDLPSWVPDWSSPHLYADFGFAAELVQYRASLTSANGEVNTNQSSQSWTVRGRIVDITSDLVEPLELHWPTDVGTALPLQMGARNLQWQCRCSLAWVESICALLPIDECDPTGRPYYPDSVARTIIGNMTSHLQVTKAPPEYVDYFTEWQVFNKAVAATNVMDPDSEDLRAYFTQAQLPANSILEGLDSAVRFGTTLSQQGTRYRRVFLSHKGYLGLGPPGVQQGDIVCIILGRPTPFLLRTREKGGYYLVGDCYVDGLMDGEGMSMGEEQDIDLY